MRASNPENELLVGDEYKDVSDSLGRELDRSLESLRGKKGLVIAAGGLAPGVSTVLQNIVGELDGIAEVYGLDYGFAGIANANENICRLIAGRKVPKMMPFDTIPLDCRSKPGEMPLSMSRGKDFQKESSMMANFLLSNDFDFFITIGGDGTLKGTQSLNELVRRSGGNHLQIAHILKTVDGDGPASSEPFGMSSAIDLVRSLVESKNSEIRSSDGTVINLIGCMGRGSGRLPLNVAAACRQVDLVIIPEIVISAREIANRLNRIVKENGEGANVLLAEGVENIPGITVDGFRGAIAPLEKYLTEHVATKASPTKVIGRQWDYTQRSPVNLNGPDESLINSMSKTALNGLAIKAKAFSVIGPQKTLDLARPLPAPQLTLTPQLKDVLIEHGYNAEEIKKAQSPRNFETN